MIDRAFERVADPPATHIRTARLALDAITDRDVEALADVIWQERGHLAQSVAPGDSRAQLIAHLRGLVDAFSAGTRLVYVIRLADRIVGSVALTTMVERHSISLAYWLRAAEVGRGYMSEAMHAACDVAFALAARLEIWCDAQNVASAAVARRLGFVLSDVARHDERDPQCWIGDRLTAPARAAVRATCAGIAPVAADDGGTLYLDDAVVQLGLVAGQPHVVMTSDVGSDTIYNERDCLAHNATLAVGALVFWEDRLVLRYACPPGGITPETVRLFLHEADRLRGLAQSSQGAVALSTYFTD